jgi:hypothetical protein
LLSLSLMLLGCGNGSVGGSGAGGDPGGMAGFTGTAGANGAAGTTGAGGTTGAAGRTGAGGSSGNGGATSTGGANGAGGVTGTGGGTGSGGGACRTATGARFAPVTDYTARDGGFGPAVVARNTGDAALGTDRVAVFRPAAAKYGQGGVSHPIIVWGNGSTNTVDIWQGFLSRVATYGFVVVAP